MNGTEVGIETIDGHGLLNTQAAVMPFTERYLLPQVTVQIKKQTGVRAIVDRLLRNRLQPSAKDSSGNYSWNFGGRVPVPVIYGELWEGATDRY